MGLMDIKFGKFKVPVYDLGTIAAGFYVGYHHGKGVDVGPIQEPLMLYGPTIFAIGAVSLLIKGMKSMSSRITMALNENPPNYQDMTIRKNGREIEVGKLQGEDRKQAEEQITEKVKNLESKLAELTYVKPTLRAGGITAAETMIGYVAGRIYSQFG
jgi:hypothetical protein